MNAAEFSNIIIDNALLRRGDKVIAGVSAGPDSTALLCLLCSCSLDLRVVPVYVDHGLRPGESDRERRQVESLARHFDLPFEHAAVAARDHRRRHGTSLEESCRMLRYQVLVDLRQRHGAAAIAVGHTADDQVEEVLLRLCRGAGLEGLAGMRMKSGRLLRPLLHTPKEELLEYLDRLGIDSCVDSSNMDRAFLRNRLRLDILPLLRRHFNASLTETLLRTTTVLQSENDYLAQAAEEALAACTAPLPASSGEDGGHALARAPFLRHHLALRRRVAEKVLLRCGIRPQFHHIETVCRFAEQAGNGREQHFPAGLRLFSDGDTLIFDFPAGRRRLRGRSPARTFAPRKIDLSAEKIEVPVEILGGCLHLERLKSPPPSLGPGELLLDPARLKFPLLLRPTRLGDRFRPLGMEGSKTVRRFLADCKIVRQRRDRYPVLVCGEDIVAVAGLRADDRYAARSTTAPCLLVRWQTMLSLP